MQPQASAIGTEMAHPTASKTPADQPVSMLAYRSRAVVVPTDDELDLILRAAQERNRRERLTGLLIYDDGWFHQWLEGPAEGLERVWESIRDDPRHRDVAVLRKQIIPKRFFGSWSMRLAMRPRTSTGTARVRVDGSRPARRKRQGACTAWSTGGWDDIFADVVVPQLAGWPQPAAAAAGCAPLVWHAPPEAPADLAELLLATECTPASKYVDRLVEQGVQLEALYRELFEPSARCLGNLWHDDRKSEIEVTLGLARLQFEVRRLSTMFARPLRAVRPWHAVLIAPEPGEPHGLNAAMSSELFCRDGWDVTCECPVSDQMLRQLVHDQWFDVLNLSLSVAFRREHRLAAMVESIRCAQAASLNPALAVIVDGRAFFERPGAYRDVGADAGCVTVVEAVAAARKLLDGLATQSRIEQALVGPEGVERSGLHPDRARPDGLDPARGSIPSPGTAAAGLRLFQRRLTTHVFDGEVID